MLFNCLFKSQDIKLLKFWYCSSLMKCFCITVDFALKKDYVKLYREENLSPHNLVETSG